jgi:hypothetical protein
MAVGLSTRLLYALQPIEVLVRDHLSTRIYRHDFEPRHISGKNMPKFETSKGDRIRSEILRTPRKAPADLRPVLFGCSQRHPGVGRRQGNPS